MSDTRTIEDIKVNTKLAKKYIVYILNDNYSTVDFVIATLMKFFDKSFEDAKDITNKVHHEGRGVCGIYTKQIAEMKTYEANQFAKINSQPLKTIFLLEGE